ncbi:unnamed protein product [Nezara viridula]|uniref:Uncharacterized protein n=1 Tax=Nezara viridula TaxID=85310 RepID=A0A9P0H7L3_NEZVI|nr:unnamed protein product [Nezara viridula]
MSDERLPRQCFNRLRALDSSIGKPDPTYNWVTQVKMIVAELGCQGLFSCVFSQGVMRFKDEIMEKIRNHHASKDIDRVLNSKSNPRYRKICSFNVTRAEDYLQGSEFKLIKSRSAVPAALRHRPLGLRRQELGDVVGVAPPVLVDAVEYDVARGPREGDPLANCLLVDPARDPTLS